jgi:N4-gp56 family major capsid protein
MSLNNIQAEIWAGRVLQNLARKHVYAQTGIVNRDYEGDIKKGGDTVRITGIGAITIGTYTKNTDISDPQALTDSQSTLVIDQSKYFAFQIDDTDQAQASIDLMDTAMMESAKGLRNTSDLFVAGLYTGVAAANIIGLGNDTTPLVPTATTMYEYFVQAGILLDEADVPSEDRWAIIPPWIHGLLLKDDRFVKAGTAMTDATLRNGEVGEAAGFRVLKSNNVPNTSATKYKVMWGHPMAISYAEQIASVERYRREKRFADAVKGLHLYGGKLVRPTALAVGTFNKT